MLDMAVVIHGPFIIADGLRQFEIDEEHGSKQERGRINDERCVGSPDGNHNTSKHGANAQCGGPRGCIKGIRRSEVFLGHDVWKRCPLCGHVNTMKDHHHSRQPNHPNNIAGVVDKEKTKRQYGLYQVGDHHQVFSVKPICKEAYERLQKGKTRHADGKQQPEKKFTARVLQDQEEQSNGVEPFSEASI